MAQDLCRLIYYSRNRTGGSDAEMAATVNHILNSARRNNAMVGVTGALIFNAGCFGQVLEGPEAGVMQTFERIQQDERHGDVFVLSFGPVAGRVFDRWSMGFVGATVPEAQGLDLIAAGSGYDPSCMTGDALFETLQRLVVEEERPLQAG